jgi:hypothetical protein
MVYCTYVIADQCKDKKLAELREYLNEENDFDPDQRKILDECPEFQEM